MDALPDTMSKQLALSRDSFAAFSRFITCELGIKMSPNKVPMLQSRLQRRLRELGLPSLEAYRDYLFNSDHGEEERVHFIDVVTTNKTDFFREPRHFDFLVQTALPELDPEPAVPPDARRPWHFRLWCAGCSSGEEPYTLSMVLSEYAHQRPGFDFTLLATDISTRMLEHAAMGIYDTERIAPVPMALRAKYLLRSREPAHARVRIVPELRRRIEFRRLNFMDAAYRVREVYDAIFFRNVMIYFDKPTQEAVIGKLCQHLAPGGYLFVGHSESLTGLNVPVTCAGTALYRKIA